MERIPQTVRVTEPASSNGRGIVLTHGAGSNLDAPVLRAAAESLAAAGWVVVRCNLAFREERRTGSPFPAGAARDRESLRQAVEDLRSRVAEIYLGGHSYGGRQASMLAAEDPALVKGLLLLSYPLHPPRKPEQLRTAHFPELRTPALFVHGTRDPFGSMEEMESAVAGIPGPHGLVRVEGAGHDLARRGKAVIPNIEDDCVRGLAAGLDQFLGK